MKSLIFLVEGWSFAKRISFTGSQNFLRNRGHPLQRILHLRNCLLRKFGKSVIGYRMVQRIGTLDSHHVRRLRQSHLQTRRLSVCPLVRHIPIKR